MLKQLTWVGDLPMVGKSVPLCMRYFLTALCLNMLQVGCTYIDTTAAFAS